MATPSKCKRIVLNLKQKLHAIEELEKGKPAYRIAIDLGVGKTQIQDLKKRKREIYEDIENNVSLESKRKRHVTGNEQINDLTYAWFLEATGRGIPLNGPLIQMKALSFATQLNKTEFKASKGWLDSFNKRHNIVYKSLCGERGDMSKATVDSWKDCLPSLCDGYENSDIFNMDETGLFFRDTTRHTFSLKDSECAGGKRSKERITVALCASLTGEKIRPLVIGKSRSPRCFGRLDVKSLPVLYFNNKKAWMDSYIYEQFLKYLNKTMRASSRNILLFVDNAPSHPDISLSNVKVRFLPPNTTSLTQPMDQGIIQAMKLNFRKHQLQHILRQMERQASIRGSQLLKQITVLDAIYWVSTAWSNVKESTINKCFMKAGFALNSYQVDSLTNPSKENTDSEDEDYDIPLALLRTSRELFDCDFRKLDELDNGVATCDTQQKDWDRPVQQLLAELEPDQCVGDSDEDGDEDSIQNLTAISIHDALDYVEKLKSFATSSGNTNILSNLVAIENDISQIMLVKQKQLVITDFFGRNT